jgi:hypothetical protein
MGSVNGPGNEEDAPLPAVRGTAMEPRGIEIFAPWRVSMFFLI